jgi:hypothetical protein
LILKTLKNYNEIFLAAQENPVAKFPLVAPGHVPPNLKKYFLKKNSQRKAVKGSPPAV